MIRNVMTAALKAAGHYYDFDSNVLYMTSAFQKKVTFTAPMSTKW